MTQLTIITTGGTFDKSYNPMLEGMDFSLKSVLPSLLKEARVRDFDLRQLYQMDSLGMDDGHRSEILAAVENASTGRVVIVHGTSSMLLTAQHLSEVLGKSKIVVLTGALTPFRYDAVEASCNLGSAIAAARVISQGGIYIAMHGMVDDWQYVQKSKKDGVFTNDLNR